MKSVSGSRMFLRVMASAGGGKKQNDIEFWTDSKILAKKGYFCFAGLS